MTLSAYDLEAFGYYDMFEDKQMTIPEMVEQFRVTMDQEKSICLSLLLVKEEFKEWYESVINGPITKEGDIEELKELADLVYVIFGYANALGWDLMEAVRRVHKNNLDRCVWPDGKVHKREDGKVLKNPDAPKVNLEDLV